MRKTFALLALAAVLACASCSPEPIRISDTYLDHTFSFDTVSRLDIYTRGGRPAGEAGKRAADVFSERIEYYGRLLDIYNPCADMVNLHEINRSAGAGPVKVGPDMMEFLLFAESVHSKTDGRVNIAIGALTRLWHDKREQAAQDPDGAGLPDPAELLEASRHTDISCMVLDGNAMTVTFTDPLLRLDAGALAKGWAQERIGREIEAAGGVIFLIDMGGNLFYSGTGDPSKPDTLRLGVHDPSGVSGNGVHAVFELAGGSVSTSGDYQRFFTVDGVRYAHIIDPATLYPPSRYSSVTVVCRDSGLADAYSTLLFLTGIDEGLEFCEAEGISAYWIYPDGSSVKSAGFAGMMK